MVPRCLSGGWCRGPIVGGAVRGPASVGLAPLCTGRGGVTGGAVAAIGGTADWRSVSWSSGASRGVKGAGPRRLQALRPVAAARVGGGGVDMGGCASPGWGR